jgi:UPF0271 protein
VKKKIDINCDMGESLDFLNTGHDEALMAFISSVNIACGFHAGSQEIMERTIENAQKYNLNIGAHPGFDDKTNFSLFKSRLIKKISTMHSNSPILEKMKKNFSPF